MCCELRRRGGEKQLDVRSDRIIIVHERKIHPLTSFQRECVIAELRITGITHSNASSEALRGTP